MLSSNKFRLDILETDNTTNKSNITSNISRIGVLEVDNTSNIDRLDDLETDVSSNKARLTDTEDQIFDIVHEPNMWKQLVFPRDPSTSIQSELV